MKPYRDSYYFLARDDVSAFHQFLANAALHRTLYTSGGKILTSHEATSQHHKALQLAQIRIGNIEGRLSDGMIATVLMMAAYYVCNLSHLRARILMIPLKHISLDFDAWEIHMDGIEQILNLRGGIDTLNSNIRLRLLISWYL